MVTGDPCLRMSNMQAREDISAYRERRHGRHRRRVRNSRDDGRNGEDEARISAGALLKRTLDHRARRYYPARTDNSANDFSGGNLGVVVSGPGRDRRLWGLGDVIRNRGHSHANGEVQLQTREQREK
jgi:hypothetical protein